jgi:hypothetical protein
VANRSTGAPWASRSAELGRDQRDVVDVEVGDRRGVGGRHGPGAERRARSSTLSPATWWVGSASPQRSPGGHRAGRGSHARGQRGVRQRHGLACPGAPRGGDEHGHAAGHRDPPGSGVRSNAAPAPADDRGRTQQFEQLRPLAGGRPHRQHDRGRTGRPGLVVRAVRPVPLAHRRRLRRPDRPDLPPRRRPRHRRDLGTVRVAFDRPEVRNAFRPHTVDELYRVLDHARRPPTSAACC